MKLSPQCIVVRSKCKTGKVSMATEEEGGSIGSRQMYTVPGDGSGSVTCITCQLPTSRGGVCKMNSINMNWDNSYYIHTCRGEVSLEN